MKPDTEILIAGAGLNGTALALALAGVGFDVTIVDPIATAAKQTDSFDGRGYALALTSQRLLDAIGVWTAVSEQSQPILEVKVTDGRAGEGPSSFVLEFDHAEIEEGPMGYMVEDRYLRRALLEKLDASSKITQITQDSVVAQTADATGVAITLHSGKTLRAGLLIGCDGRRSGTAERAGIKRTGWSYDQTALVCALQHELPHDGIAHQFFMPPGPLAILPLPGNRSSIVWTESTAEAARIAALDDTEYLEALRPRFGDFLGQIELTGGAVFLST